MRDVDLRRASQDYDSTMNKEDAMKTKTSRADGYSGTPPSVRVPRYDPELAKPIINQEGAELQLFGTIWHRLWRRARQWTRD